MLAFFGSLVFATGQGTLLSTIHAYPNGSCEVPPNDSAYVGIASFDFNPFGGTSVVCSVNFDPPFSPSTAAIHGPAQPGGTAPLLFNLGSFSVVTNIRAVVSCCPPATNYYTNITVVCTNTVILTQEQMSQFLGGLFYVNVASTNFPDGEVRGQITEHPVLSLPISEQGNPFTFKVTAPPSNSYTIQLSSNLADWFTLTNFAVTTSVFTVTDPESRNYRLRFYRARR